MKTKKYITAQYAKKKKKKIGSVILEIISADKILDYFAEVCLNDHFEVNSSLSRAKVS